MASRQVTRLRDMIAESRHQADDFQPLWNLLHQFERSLLSHIASRDRLRKEL